MPEHSHLLPKSALLRKSAQYNHVYAHGRRLYGKGFGFVLLTNEQQKNRLGISVSGAKSAVKRNRKKRLIREFYRLNPGFFEHLATQLNIPSPVDIVVTTNKHFSPQKFQALSVQFYSVLKHTPAPAAESAPV